MMLCSPAMSATKTIAIRVDAVTYLRSVRSLDSPTVVVLVLVVAVAVPCCYQEQGPVSVSRAFLEVLPTLLLPIRYL